MSDEPPKPTRRKRKRVEPAEPQPAQEPRRRRAFRGKGVPGWKVAGNAPYTRPTEEER